MESESRHKSASGSFVCFTTRAPDADTAERLCAEAWLAGASGIEEREVPRGVELLIYAPSAEAAAVRAAVAALAGAGGVGALEAVPDTDWSESWKHGLEAIEISPRLLLRPHWVECALRPGQVELLVDPGHAFGTGSHLSTRLALEWIDALVPDLPRGARVLDVGTGSGVLALAALRLGAAEAVALDLDPLAAPAARANAAANGLGGRLRLFTGPLAAVGGAPFELVVANLLQNELLPLLADVAARTRPDGRAVFSGLLSSQCDAVLPAFAAAGFALRATREGVDASGERWSALLMTR